MVPPITPAKTSYPLVNFSFLPLIKFLQNSVKPYLLAQLEAYRKAIAVPPAYNPLIPLAAIVSLILSIALPYYLVQVTIAVTKKVQGPITTV